MFEGVINAVQTFIHQYGFVAVFVYMALETSFILHFVPSEVVVPFAAAELVHGPVTFVLFVVDATAGATTGSLIAYVVFGRYGEAVLDRYGSLFHVSHDDVDRSQRWFRRYGESSVFWGRMLPFLRALVSIPAGLAEMRLSKFTFYSAAGAALFNTALTYLVYTGSGTTSPLGILWNVLHGEIFGDIAYVNAHTDLVIVVGGAVLLLAAAVWLARDWLRANPAFTKTLTLHTVRIVGLLVGGLLVLGALTAPEHAFTVVVAVWEEPGDLLHLGFSEQLALVLSGVLVALAGTLCYEIGELVTLSLLEPYVTRLRAVFIEW